MNILANFLKGRMSAYRHVFKGPYGEEVLADLAKFCRANASTFHSDPRMSAQLDGRREVWLRIMEHLHLTEEEMLALRRVNGAEGK